jgi:POTRA domain-containing FtsQ-type protein
MTLRPRPPSRRPVSIRPTARRSIGAPARRTRSIRRASAGLTPVRAGAILVILLSASAMYGVAHSPVFSFAAPATVEGATFTDEAAVRAVLEEARGANLFALVTPPLEERIRELPTVRSADVSVRLPDTLAVRLRERTPILVWQVGARRYLVDTDGQLFARLPDAPPEGAATLPVVEDRRAASVGLSVGRALDRVDLDAATRLASLVPADVGSEAQALYVFVSDVNGFTLRTKPATWQAVFGFYTPTLRTPELIPGQVRLLRSLLIGREPLIDRIILASETDGTYTTKASTTPSETPVP